MATFSPLTEEERFLAAHIRDLCRTASRSPRFTSFLNEKEQAIAEGVLREQPGLQGSLFGGYEEAQRRMLSIAPEDSPPNREDFPLVAIAALHGRGEALSHRSVLGSLLGLGLERSSVGDILPSDGICRFLVLSTVAEVVLQDLSRIGRTGVRCQRAPFEELVLVQEFEELRSTVSSPRLDCLVSMLTNLARDKSAALIKSGLVQQNYRETAEISARFTPGDIITIRGYGKYIVDSVGEPTRKGRLPVCCRKYK